MSWAEGQTARGGGWDAGAARGRRKPVWMLGGQLWSRWVGPGIGGTEPQAWERSRGQLLSPGTAPAWSRHDSRSNRPGKGRWRFPGPARRMAAKEQGRRRARGRRTFAVRLLWAVSCRMRGLLSLTTALPERAEPRFTKELRHRELKCLRASFSLIPHQPQSISWDALGPLGSNPLRGRGNLPERWLTPPACGVSPRPTSHGATWHCVPFPSS